MAEVGRMEAVLEELRQRIADFEEHLGTQAADLQQRFVEQDLRLEQRLGQLERQPSGALAVEAADLQQRFVEQESRLEQRLGQLEWQPEERLRDLELQLTEVSQRAAEADETIPKLSGRLDVLEKVFLRAHSQGGFLSRLAGLERLCDEVRQESEQARTRLEVRIGASLAGMQPSRSEMQLWERRAGELERRMVELEDGIRYSAAASGARSCTGSVDVSSGRDVRILERKFGDFEGRFLDMEERVRSVCATVEDKDNEEAKMSLAGMLDLDKQVFELDLRVSNLQHKLLSVDDQLAVLATPRRSTRASVAPGALQATVLDMDLQVKTATADVEDLSQRFEALETLQNDLLGKPHFSL